MKHHVLEQVREAGAILGLHAKSDAVIDRGDHRRRREIGRKDHAQAVGQFVVGDGHVEVYEAPLWLTVARPAIPLRVLPRRLFSLASCLPSDERSLWPPGLIKLKRARFLCWPRPRDGTRARVHAPPLIWQPVERLGQSVAG